MCVTVLKLGELLSFNFFEKFLSGKFLRSRNVLERGGPLSVAMEWLAIGLSVAWADYENRKATK